MKNKSTVGEIRARFDADVERFSNLETGQTSTVDAALSLELITEAARRVKPDAAELLDIGCGAGNYTLKLLEKLPDLNCTLVDLSAPMLERARGRISQKTKGTVRALQADIREADLPENHYDIVLAGAVLHHLRDEADWLETFLKIARLVKKGGWLFVSDLVAQHNAALTAYMWENYAAYLTELGGADYAQKVLAYVEKEDSPRSLNFQFNMLKRAGFSQVDLLHKNVCFAAFAACK